MIRKNTSRNKIFYEWGNSIFVTDDEWFIKKFTELNENCPKFINASTKQMN